MNCIAFCMSRQNGTGCQLVGEMRVGKMGLTCLTLSAGVGLEYSPKSLSLNIRHLLIHFNDNFGWNYR